ncbi:hypothetical protein ABK040_011850 [Willaertia magna]
MFLEFLENRNITFPANEQQIRDFLTFYYMKASGNSAKQTFFAISNMYKELSLSNPCDNFLTKQLIKRMINEKQFLFKLKRDPISMILIEKWCQEGRQFCISDLEFVTKMIVIIVGFRLLSRVVEIGILNREDVEVKERLVILNFFKTKTRVDGRIVTIDATDSNLCPVKWIKHYISIRDKQFPNTEVFIPDYITGRRINSEIITDYLRNVSQQLNIEGTYSSYSLKASGISQVGYKGLARSTIMLVADAKFNAINAYFRHNVETGVNFSKELGF